MRTRLPDNFQQTLQSFLVFCSLQFCDGVHIERREGGVRESDHALHRDDIVPLTPHITVWLALTDTGDQVLLAAPRTALTLSLSHSTDLPLLLSFDPHYPHSILDTILDTSCALLCRSY